MELSLEQILKIKELLQKYDQIVCYTDGSSIKNPGYSGAGVAFYGIK